MLRSGVRDAATSSSEVAASLSAEADRGNREPREGLRRTPVAVVVGPLVLDCSPQAAPPPPSMDMDFKAATIGRCSAGERVGETGETQHGYCTETQPHLKGDVTLLPTRPVFLHLFTAVPAAA